MDGIVLGLFIGFFLGSFGYVLSRFILSPLFRYRKIKRALVQELQVVGKSVGKEKLTKQDIAHIDNLHRHAQVLVRYVELEMPVWFKLSLERKDENPLLAASELMTLANIRTPDHLEKRMVNVRKYLKLDSKQ